jgi:hypothetical protein
VLFVGDSIMDQQGNHAAVLLRESGIAARVEARWGSTLFTPGQYRDGEPHFERPAGDPSAHWLALAPGLVADYDPTLVVAELNHNYWLPLPTDTNGRPITDLTSVAAQEMVREQLHAFVGLLRAGGASVAWVAPTPSETQSVALWPLMLPVLRDLDVPVIDPNAALRAADGTRRSSAPTCTGERQPLYLDDQIHLTRLGAGLSATPLAREVAREVGVPLVDAAAPGQPVVAIVPWGRTGYHLVQCDGSVFHFGAAPIVGSARSAISGGEPVVDARRSPDGGLWLVRGDGTVVSVGASPARAVIPIRPTTTHDITLKVSAGTGAYRLVHPDGTIEEFGGAPDLGDATESIPDDPFAAAWATAHPRPPVSDAAAVTGGYYVVTANGELVARGEAEHRGDLAQLALYTA